MIRKALSLLSITLVILASCDDFKDASLYYHYEIPVNDEFGYASLADVHIDEGLITAMTNKIIQEQYKRVDAVLIFRNGKMVYENYFHGYSPAIRHNMFSCSKSITSMLIGIAIDKGIIKGVDATVNEMLPQYTTFANDDPRKATITIENLLNMSAGWDCDDWYKDTETQMSNSSDGVKFTLDLPLINDPGTVGTYCTGGVVTLGRIIETQSGMSLDNFANQYLFKPLHITEYKWSYGKDGKVFGGGKLFLRPRDMAKIGLLMLDSGKWNGTQILSQEWVKRSSENLLKLPGPFSGYGYLWWKQTFPTNDDVYFASGNGGQDIFVVPSKNTVAVFTAGNKNTTLGLQNIDMMWSFILPALK